MPPLCCLPLRGRHLLKRDNPALVTTDLFIVDMSMDATQEACLTDGERFVGSTARFDEVSESEAETLPQRAELQIIPLRPELRLEGYIKPPFPCALVNVVAALIQASRVGRKVLSLPQKAPAASVLRNTAVIAETLRLAQRSLFPRQYC